MATQNGPTKGQLAQIIAAIVAQAPGATATAPPAWLAEAIASGATAQPSGPRAWTRDVAQDRTSKSGNPVVVFVATMKNGRAFSCSVPRDLAVALQSGQVKV